MPGRDVSPPERSRALRAIRPRTAAGLLAALVGLLALAASGCGAGRRVADGTVRGTKLTIYSSMPLEGPDRPAAIDVVRAERLALEQDGGRVGPFRVRLVALDAARPGGVGSDPGQISANARRAAADPQTIAYVGELHPGSSAISIPLLNEAGILQVSPLDTAMELTTPSAAVTGSPQKYYPNLKRVGRTFARVVPSDRVQAGALVRYMSDERVRRLALLTDPDQTGLGLLRFVRAAARGRGIAIVANDHVDEHAQDHRDLIARLRVTAPDAVLYAGTAQGGGVVRLWRQLAASAPAMKLFAPGVLVDAPFVAAVGAAADAATYVTQPVLVLDAYPRAARRFARMFARRYGPAPRPQALYGFATMEAVLAAIRRAERAPGGLRRSDVVRELFHTRERGGVLGPYAIDRAGDTSLARYGAYRVVAGRLLYTRPLDG